MRFISNTDESGIIMNHESGIIYLKWQTFPKCEIANASENHFTCYIMQSTLSNLTAVSLFKFIQFCPGTLSLKIYLNSLKVLKVLKILWYLLWWKSASPIFPILRSTNLKINWYRRSFDCEVWQHVNNYVRPGETSL